MYCGNCGKELTEQSKFCQHCGSEVNVSSTKVMSKGKTSGKKRILPWFFAGCGVVIALIFVISLLGGNREVIRKAEGLLEDDLGASVNISELYHNEDKEACWVKFKTKSSADVAAIYLKSGKVLYGSDQDYYNRMFNNATSSAERGKWSSKVLEYGDLATWNFKISVMKADGKTEDGGWKKIK